MAAIEDRRAAVAELTEQGMSTREIADSLGVGQQTVVRDQHADSSDASDSSESSEREPEPEPQKMESIEWPSDSDESPEPELTRAERETYQRETDRLNAIRRHQVRLRELVNGWVEIPGLADNPDREAILAGLVEPDRERVLEIESIYLRASESWPMTSMAASTSS